MRYWLTFCILAVFGLGGSLWACLACLQNLREPGQAFYGINADPIGDMKYDELRRFNSTLKEIGAGSVRLPIAWDVVESTKGEFNFRRADAVLNFIPAECDVVVVLTGVPDWAKSKEPGSAYPFENLSDWGNYVGQTIKHYTPRIRCWEIWNGPNRESFIVRPDATAYAAMLKVSYEEAKRADESCLVILGGLDVNGIDVNPLAKAGAPNFIEDLYKAGAGPYFDACNIQPCVVPVDGAPRVLQLAKDTLDVMARYGDQNKILYLSEIGCAATDDRSEEAQAKLLQDVYEAAKGQKQIAHIFWYAIRDTEHDRLRQDSSMGLVDRSWRKKPAYAAFKKASQEKVIR